MLSDETRGSSSPVVIPIAYVVVFVHFLTAGRYGIFRDELYYIACARHLGAGYVDHPSLIAWIIGASALAEAVAVINEQLELQPA